MIIPLTWLKDYIKTTKTSKEIARDFTALGLMLDKPLSADVLDLEHRMDRADWLSITGCARDLAAFEKVQFTFPELYTQKGKEPTEAEKIEIKVECPNLVKRFTTKTFRGITVKESPEWLKARLEAYGMPSINNIVDITNYVMIELGQPLHAQDLAKLEKSEIVIRPAKQNEEITTLLGETIKLDPSIFVLTQNDRPTVIGGIVGGNKTGVDTTTKNIILDAGNYDQNNIRKSSRKLKIQNETVMRTDKILDPRLTEIAINRATKLILDIAGGEVYENYDYYPIEVEPKVMKITLNRIKMVGGLDLSIEKVKTTLSALGYKTIEEKLYEMTVEVPYFRTDVEVEDDLVADVLRMYDYNKIPTRLAESAPPKEITQPIYNFEDKLRDICVNLGLHEHITDPIVSSEGLPTSGIVLENSLNSEKTALRTNIYQTLYPVVEIYQKNNIAEVGLFEVGKVYFKTGKGDDLEDYIEERQLQVIYSFKNATVLETAKKIKQLLAGVIFNLGIKVTYERENKLEAKIYSNNSEKTKVLLGYLSHDSFTLYTEALLRMTKSNLRVKQDMQNSLIEDISLVMNIEQPVGKIINEILEFDKNIIELYVVDTFSSDTLGEGKKSVTVRMETTSKNAENKDKLIKHLEETYKIAIRA